MDTKGGNLKYSRQGETTYKTKPHQFEKPKKKKSFFKKFLGFIKNTLRNA